MNNVGFISYTIGAVTFAFLSVLLLVKWRATHQAILLIIASLITTIWAISCAFLALQQNTIFLTLLLEMVKAGAWILFLIELLRKREYGISRSIVWLVVIVWCTVLLGTLLALIPVVALMVDASKIFTFGVLIIVLLGLILVEQLYRNTPNYKRWAIKYLCLGLGGMFVYDIFLYSNAVLFWQFNPIQWNARGIVTAFFAPLIAISAARNPDWSIDPFVSRHIIFYTTSLSATAIYMIIMAVTGFYIKEYGGSWGSILQIIFFVGAIMVLMIVMFSGQTRAYLKQFISEHFYSNKYDYREEWLRLMGILFSSSEELPIHQRVLKGITQIVESQGGVLWLRKDNNDNFYLAATWNMDVTEQVVSRDDNLFLGYIEAHQWTIDILEYQKHPEQYEDLILPDWLILIPQAWLIVPIMHQQTLYGFVLLKRSRAAMHHTWEDSELLRTVGQQVSSYLAQHDAAQKLSEAQQFETFYRLSAFVVHDLKNLVAQLGLVVANSKKFIDEPEFMRDAMMTVDNAVIKMNRMLNQLRKGHSENSEVRIIQIDDILETVINKRNNYKPKPRLEKRAEKIFVLADKVRLTAIFEHLVQNAQEATDVNGNVTVFIEIIDGKAVIKIKDDGCGMDSDFVRDRLFKPFDTTKGNAGMGLGAYESQELIRELGGEISVDSTIGEGTIITVRIPLRENDIEVEPLKA